MKRVLFIVLAIVIAVSCFAVSVSAAEYISDDLDNVILADTDSSDPFAEASLYIDDVSTAGVSVGGYDSYILDFGSRITPWGEVLPASGGKFTFTGTYASIRNVASNTYGFDYYLFGRDTSVSLYRGLYVGDFTGDTYIELNFEPLIAMEGSTGFTGSRFIVRYHSTDGSIGARYYYPFTVNDYYTEFKIPIHQIEGFGYITIQYEVTGITVYADGSYVYGASDLRMTLFTKSPVIGAIDDVNQSIGETNDKLDHIIDDEVTTEKPGNSDVVDDFDEKEDEVLDSIVGGFGEGQGIITSTLEDIAQFASGFGAVAYVFSVFYELPFIKLIVYLSFGLGLFGSMCGIVSLAGNRFIGRGKGKGGKD